MKNDKWFKELLTQIPYWQDLPKTRFHFNPLYRVGVGKKSNLDYIFGKKRKFSWRNLRKFEYFSFEASLPEDSVIFFQPTRQRLIIASREERKVLKITTSQFQLAMKDTELALLRRLENSEFAPHSVKVLEEGSNWSVTLFHSNFDALYNIKHVEQYLMKNADPLIMEPMAKFYRSNPLQKIPFPVYLEKAKERVKGHPEERILRQFIDTFHHDSRDLIHGQLHLDLHAGNILRDGNDIVIIDFEVTHPGLLLVDYFDFYRRYLNKNFLEQRVFWHYMKGDHLPSKQLEDFFLKFKAWVKQFGVPGPDLKNCFKLYALERTLIYWDKWQDNRLKDKKGLEFKTIDFVLRNSSQEHKR